MQRSTVQRCTAVVGSPVVSPLAGSVSSYSRPPQSHLTNPHGKAAQQHTPPLQPALRGDDTRTASQSLMVSAAERLQVLGEGTNGVTGVGVTGGDGGGDAGGGPYSVTIEPAVRDVLLGRDGNNTVTNGIAGLISIAHDDTNCSLRALTNARDGKRTSSNDSSNSGSCEIIDVGGGQSIINGGSADVPSEETAPKRHRNNAMEVPFHIPNVATATAAVATSAAPGVMTTPITQTWRWQEVTNGAESSNGDFVGAPTREPVSLSSTETGVLQSTVSGEEFTQGDQFLRERRGRPSGSKRSRPAVACVETGCKRPPTYGTPGDNRAAYCAGHGKLRGLQNIVTPRCRHRYSGDERCPLWPAFGRETDKSPTYCAQHALEGMKNINNPKCRGAGCGRWPSFGVQGTKTALYCGGHKMEGMVDVVKPRCREEGGCSHRPSFGWQFDRVPLYCRAHKAAGMVDVANPRCAFNDCIRRPSFGIDGQRASRCSAHKMEGMVDVVKPRCRLPECQRIAYYKIKGTKGATRCSQHQEEGMVRKN